MRLLGIAALSWIVACSDPPPPEDLCATAADCPAGQACINGRCEDPPPDAGPPPPVCEDGCDDGNVCTNDECVDGECVFVPVAIGCDDGDFCNGVDECIDGTCTSRGDPCTAPTSCDPESARCVGCFVDDDCPGETATPYGACEYDDVCLNEGVRRRTVTTSTCEEGVCVANDREETEACTRDSSGATCGETVVGEWSGCDYEECAETAPDQIRGITEFRCADGACAATSGFETGACMRETDGMGCADGWTCRDETCRPLAAFSHDISDPLLQFEFECLATGEVCRERGCTLFCEQGDSLRVCCSFQGADACAEGDKPVEVGVTPAGAIGPLCARANRYDCLPRISTAAVDAGRVALRCVVD